MISQSFYSDQLSFYKTGVQKKEVLHEYFEKSDIIAQMEGFSIKELLSFLKVSHQYYLKKKLPEIEQSLLHITSRYSESHVVLSSLAYFFSGYKNKLVKHMRMEDDILFPYIEELIEPENSEEKIKQVLAKNTLQHFEENHDAIEDELSEVNEILFKHSSQSELPMPFRIFLNQISQFETELKKHAIIEDEVLLPKVFDLQRKLSTAL